MNLNRAASERIAIFVDDVPRDSRAGNQFHSDAGGFIARRDFDGLARSTHPRLRVVLVQGGDLIPASGEAVEGECAARIGNRRLWPMGWTILDLSFAARDAGKVD